MKKLLLAILVTLTAAFAGPKADAFNITDQQLKQCVVMEKFYWVGIEEARKARGKDNAAFDRATRATFLAARYLDKNCQGVMTARAAQGVAYLLGK